MTKAYAHRPQVGWLLLLTLSLLAALPAFPDESQAKPADGDGEAWVSRPIGEPQGPPRSGAELEAATTDLASRLRCPVCQGLSVADSPSISAQAIREEINSLLAEGYSEDQITVYFEGAYGEFVRLLPKPEGFNLLVWIVPAVGILLGLAIVLFNLRRGSGEHGDRPAEDVDPELSRYRQLVHDETNQ